MIFPVLTYQFLIKISESVAYQHTLPHVNFLSIYRYYNEKPYKLCQKIENGIISLLKQDKNKKSLFFSEPLASYSEGIFLNIAQIIRQKVFVCLGNLLITEIC